MKVVEMKKWFYLWFCFFFGATVFSQNTFEPGYIITTSGDTLQGFVLEKNDAAMAHRISFKSNLQATIERFKATELSGFGFNNGREFQQMPIRVLRGTAWDTSYIFAKNMLRGKIDLFVWRHPQKVRPDIFLYNNVSGKTAHLQKPAKREQEIDGKTYIVRDDRYIGFLNLIKKDSITSIVSEPVKFYEKHIKRDILSYNQEYQASFPVQEYSEKIKRTTDILAGLPISSHHGGLHFRLGVYRQIKNTEKFSNFSLFRGIVYHHWSDDSPEVPSIRNGSSNFRWQFLNIIPVGINFHGDRGWIRPYGYAGLGAGVVMLTDKVVENRVYTGDDETKFVFFPSLNAGLGLKIKTGNTYIITELTPTINNIFFNLGISL